MTPPDDANGQPRQDTGLDVVTGAFSYSGAAIARAPDRRRAPGPDRSPATPTGPAATPAIEVRPLDFDDQLGLVESLRGATTLYNTYWVRFAHGQIDHELAVANSRTLFRRPGAPACRRIVHVSITNPSITSPLALLPGEGTGGAGPGRVRGRRSRSCARPSCSAATGCCSTTSPGCCGTCRSSPSAAAGTTASEASTSTISPALPWPRGPEPRTA